MTREKLDLILQQHKLWLEDDIKGKCADLNLVNLRDFDLSDVNLTYANLIGANLSDADLSYTNLTGANLTYANLSDANLTYANLSDANLIYANLKGAYLTGANLTGANLTGANLINIEYNSYTPFFALQCPESGSFTAYKSARGYIVELLIPKNAKRSSSTNRKCRADRAKVIAIYNLDRTKSDLTEIASGYDKTFVYKVGKTLIVKDFDENRWEDCSAGIHFFITFDEAKQY